MIDINKQTQGNLLWTLIGHSSEATKTLFQLLQPKDINNLKNTSKVLHETIEANSQLYNWLYYSERLAIQRSYCLDKQIYGISEKLYMERVWNLCSNNMLDFKECHNTLKAIEFKFFDTLNKLISKQQSKLIFQQFRRILIDPEPPRPVMRRKTVGQLCRSAVQIKLATEGYASTQQVYLSEQDEALKKSLLEKAETILNQLKNPKNYKIIMQLRYRGQLNTLSLNSESLFITLIKLILQITKIFIVSLRLYFQAVKQTLPTIDFLQEYVYRYSLFKNSMMQLDEKFLYLFQQFQYAFHEAFPKYPIRPRFNLWRIMMKQWVNQMSDFHLDLSKAAGKICIQLIQTQIQSKIVNQTSDQQTYSQFNNCFKLQKFKAPRSAILSSTYDSYVLTTLFQQCIEYIIDASSNSQNVHWYGSTELRLGKTYSQFQEIIVNYSKQYFKQVVQSFSSQFVKIKLSQFFVESVLGILKPTTAFKIQGIYKKQLYQIVEKLKGNKQQLWAKDWQFLSNNWQQQDAYIKATNIKRKIDQETAEKLKNFFNFQQTISLEEINEIASNYVPSVNNQNKQDSEGDQNKVEQDLNQL